MFFREDIQGLIASKPELEGKSSEEWTDEESFALDEWHKRVAALVDDLIYEERERWKVNINRPIDIFLAPDPTPEHQELRDKANGIVSKLAQASKRLGRLTRRLPRTLMAVRHRAALMRFPVPRWVERRPANLYQLTEYFGRCAQEPLVEGYDYFPHPIDGYFSYWSGFDAMALGKWARELGDMMSRRAVFRLDGLRLLLRELTRCEDAEEGTVWPFRRKRPQFWRNEIKELEEALLLSKQARAAEPYIVLIQTYFACRAKPDTSLLRQIDERVVRNWRGFPLRIYVAAPGTQATVARALEQLLHEDWLVQKTVVRSQEPRERVMKAAREKVLVVDVAAKDAYCLGMKLNLREDQFTYLRLWAEKPEQWVKVSEVTAELREPSGGRDPSKVKYEIKVLFMGAYEDFKRSGGCQAKDEWGSVKTFAETVLPDGLHSAYRLNLRPDQVRIL